MLKTVSDKLLVRRVRAGDCGALAPLFNHLHEPLTRFCETITGDPRSAAQAANAAFEVSVKRLAAQSIPPSEFRALLMSQARDGCYDAVTRASVAELNDEPLPKIQRMDLDELCRQVREIAPAESKGMHLRPRSRLSPATALAIGLMMVVMVDLVTMGFPFGGDKPSGRESAHHSAPAKKAANSTVALVAVEKRRATKAAKRARRHRAADRAPSAKTPAKPGSSGAQDPASPATTNSDSPAATKPDSGAAPDLPVVGELDVPPVEVKVPPVEVNAGRVDLKVDTPDVDACVGGICVGVH
jgi:hypothetical protein